MNNFKNLEGGERTQAPPELKNRIRRNVNGEVGLLRFVARVFDLYVPKVFQLFVTASNGRDSESKDPASMVTNESFDAPPPHNNPLGPNLSGVSHDERDL